mgnify:CR=1 FL=1
MLCSNIGINESGHLTFAGEDTVRLAAHYKTPLYLMDEDRIRENCRVYKAAMARAFGEGSFPLYASKAASFKRIYAIMQDEGMAIDVVSAGEILYVESVDGRSFAYTGDAVLEMPLRLCELEERLIDAGFVKVARNCLVNLCRIAGLRPYVGGRLLARLDNDEEIVISRKYAGEIRKRLDA